MFVTSSGLVSRMRTDGVPRPAHGTACASTGTSGAPGAHHRFREGVDRLLARDLPVYFKMLVMNSNLHEFDKVRAWASALQRPFRHDTFVTPRLDGHPLPLADRLPPHAAASLGPQGPDVAAEQERLRAQAAATPGRPLLFRCAAGAATFHVDARGFLHPCMMWRHDPYDLLRGSVAEWKQLVARLRERPAPPGTACTDCDLRFSCPGCAASSALEIGQPGIETAYFCDYCHARLTPRKEQCALDDTTLPGVKVSKQGPP